MMPGFDPSKMDPKVLMELSQLVRQLPPEKISQMQTLMHNMMAGFDVRQQMENFEKSLPPGFREKLSSMMMGMPGGVLPGMAAAPASRETEQTAKELNGEMDIRQARLTVLRAVAGGSLSPEEAEKLLFKE